MHVSCAQARVLIGKETVVFGSKSGAFHFRFDADNECVRTNVKPRTVVAAEAAVAARHFGIDPREEFAFGSHDMNTAWPGCPKITAGVGLHSIRQAAMLGDHGGDVRDYS